MVQVTPDFKDSPATWRQQVDDALTHEEAQTQLLYTLNLQMLRHRAFVQWAVIGFGVLLAVGTILLVVLTNA